MNSVKKYLLAGACILGLSSCNKYLDVQPTDKLLDRQVFDSKSSIEKALNGIYINLVAEELYGGNLTATTVDVMAQYYNLPGNHRFRSASRYIYTDGSYFQSDIGNIWGAAYTLLLNINQFTQSMEGVSDDVLTHQEKQLMLGEAYGLRAFVAFDLLRFFGPVYSVDSTTSLIPYPTLPETKQSPFIPANDFIDKALKDCKEAESLLQNDPIIQYGVQQFDQTDLSVNFFRARNRRMNYYAVKALMARIYLYRGDKENALKSAQSIISAVAGKFTWTPETATRSGIANPDRIFSAEVIFGPENPLRDQLFQHYFAASNILTSSITSSTTLLAPLSNRLAEIYEDQENDYRLRSSWAIDRTSNYNFKVFTKYAPLTADNAGVYADFRNIQPLMRITELYYIAAECTADKQQAAYYLNEVRANRGLLTPLTAADDISTEITKEYRKEFWGEGQLFFYYKRKKFAAIDNGSASNGSVAMNPDKYVVPLPITETQYR